MFEVVKLKKLKKLKNKKIIVGIIRQTSDNSSY